MPNADNSTHIREIDTLKGIAIFWVILGHSIIFHPINLHENAFWNAVFLFLTSVHMQLFFVISGFCFSYHGDYKHYLLKKSQRILIPYLVFNLLDMVPRYLFPQLVNRPRPIGESIRLILTDGGELWFLYVLFFLFLVYPVLYQWMSGKAWRTLPVLLALLLLHHSGTTSLFRLNEAVYYGIFFTLGVALRLQFGKSLFQLQLPRFRQLLLLLLCGALWVYWHSTHNYIWNIGAAIFGILTCYFASQFKLVDFIFNRFGPYTLQLYVLNGFTLVFSRIIICNIAGVSSPFIIVAFNLFICLFVTYLGIKYLCSRFRLLRFLMGIT